MDGAMRTHFYATIAIAIPPSTRARDRGARSVVVAGHRAISILERKHGLFHRGLLDQHVAHARCLSELLTLQDTLNQHADNDQDECHFNQCQSTAFRPRCGTACLQRFCSCWVRVVGHEVMGGRIRDI